MADGAVIQVLLGAITKLTIAEYGFLKGVKPQIKQLEKDLQWMHLEVKEAHKNRKSDENSKLYANQMSDLISDAQDVIEEFMNTIFNHKRDLQACTGLKSIINLQFQHKLGKQIGNIDASIQKLRSMEGHTTGGGSKSSNCDWQQNIKKRRSEIYNETRRLKEPVQMYESTVRQVINLLLGDESDHGKKLRIISIVGMGGVGKTTLCQKVFNDGNVVEKFKYRAFVYISDHYTSPDLLKQIMRSCDSDDSDGEVTSEKVREHLEKQKYLIVLDDIWNTDVLKHLKDVFPDAKNGSRVLLTTRQKHVAAEAGKSSVNTDDIHELCALNDETNNWKLFRKNYYSSSDTDEATGFSSNLVTLGNMMLNKCHGLPLAIVVLGDLLSVQVRKHQAEAVWSVWSSENDRSSWISNQGENSYKCQGILALSYEHLPYHLKPCFLYISLFPEDMEINVTKLFQYWIAEGLISKNGEQMLEDTAMDYLDELISRSLIQVGKRRCDGRVKTCHVHGLLHGISASESTEEEFSQAYGSIDKFNLKQTSSRRVAVYCKRKNRNDNFLSKSRNTRIRCLMCHEKVHFPGEFLSNFFGGFKLLRVLEFYDYTGIVSLPKELGDLIHLRCLSFEKPELENINTSYLRKLVNLQTLNLKGKIGHELVVGDQIWRLSQLRHLYLKNIQLGHRGISTGDKLGINSPEELQLLVIQAGDWIHDGELEKLSSLRRLKIEECLSSHSDKISSAIANLTNLRSLVLKCKTSLNPLINEVVPFSSINFQNYTSLISLHLKGSIHHGWTGAISFPPNICKLKLEWSRIMVDPMLILERLPSLRFLRLGLGSYTGMEMVCSEGGFVGLQTLELVSILTLQTWIIKEGALPSLAELEICDCKNLEMVPDGLQHVTSLKELRVPNMPQLRRRIAKKIGEDWHKIRHIPSVVS